MTANLQKIHALTPTADLFGNTLAVGDRVRSFDFPFYVSRSDAIEGMELEGERACFLEGTLEAIGEDVLEGCPRYRIQVDCWHPTPARPTRRFTVYPPVNGTPATMNPRCFGVVKLP
jgi:hypothetical protein